MKQIGKMGCKPAILWCLLNQSYCLESLPKNITKHKRKAAVQSGKHVLSWFVLCNFKYLNGLDVHILPMQIL